MRNRFYLGEYTLKEPVSAQNGILEFCPRTELHHEWEANKDRYSAGEKMSILRLHRLEGKPISEVCQEHDLKTA